jgi:hypothetical protein
LRGLDACATRSRHTRIGIGLQGERCRIDHQQVCTPPKARVYFESRVGEVAVMMIFMAQLSKISNSSSCSTSSPRM